MSLRRWLIVPCLVPLLCGCVVPGQRPVGGDRDAHGCIPSAGYTWCEAKQKCIRVWEEPCRPGEKITACYDCAGFGKIVVDYYPGNGASILAQDKRHRLEQAISASGARYEGENIMIWDKGGNARFVLNGREYACTVADCD